MQALKTIFVTGGTGNQGGAVARNLINDGFKVKVLTRNPASAAAQSLAKQGIQVIQGDLNETDTFKQHIKDADGVFSVQTFENGIEKEIKQGIDLARMAKEYNVRHFLYTSVAGADLHTGIPHWESKAEIEDCIKKLGISYTIIRPTSLYENFLFPEVKNRLVKGKLVSPIDKNIVQQFIASEDIGRISAKIFLKPDQYASQTITLAAEQLDSIEVARILSETLGKEIKYQKLPAIITRLVMGKKLYKMFEWINENSGVFIKDMQEVKKEFPNLMSLKQWIQLHFKTS